MRSESGEKRTILEQILSEEFPLLSVISFIIGEAPLKYFRRGIF